MSCCTTFSSLERYAQKNTIYQELMDEVRQSIASTQTQKALQIFAAFIQYIAKKNWRYSHEANVISLSDLSLQPTSFRPKINCLGLTQTLCELLHTHGVTDAEIHIYWPYGSSLNMKVPGKNYPGILPSYNCFDPDVNNEMMIHGEVKFSRHWVVVVDSGRLYLDPTFCCHYREREAILATETSDR